MARVLAVVMTAMLVGGGEADICPTGVKELDLTSSELRLFEDQGLWYEVGSEDLSKLSGCSCLRYDYRTPGLCSDPRYGNSREIPGTSRMPTAPYQILEIGAMGEYAVVYACIGLPYGQVVEKNVTSTYIFALDPQALEKNTIDFEGIKSRLTAQGIDATKIKIVPQPETCKYPEATTTNRKTTTRTSRATTTSTTTTTTTTVTTTIVATTTITMTTSTTVTTTIVAQIKVSGSFTMTLNGAASTDVSAVQVEAATKSAIAEHFGVAVEWISVSATESRRLNANPRRLPGTWTIVYEVLAIQAMVAFIQTKVDAATNSPATFMTTMTTNLKTYLRAAGVPATVTDGLEVTAATVAIADTTTATSDSAVSTTTFFLDYTAAAYKTAASMVVMTATAMLFSWS